MNYTKLNEITEPYAKEFTVLGNLYDGDAISKHFLKDARKLYNAAYVKEVKAFLRVAWLEEKQRLWVERFQIRTSSEEKRKELKREYAEKLAELKRQKASVKATKFANKFVQWLEKLCRNHKKREKTDNVSEEQSQKSCENLLAGDANVPDADSSAHENCNSAAPDKKAAGGT